MKGLVDKFVDFAKALPGFGLAFLIMTIAYTYLKGDNGELSPRETLAAATLCWLLYRAASYLDKLYDMVYGPDSRLRFPWRIAALRQARDKAAAALFGPIDERVRDYSSARNLRYVGDRPLKSLYSYGSTVAKPTDRWHHKIFPKVEVSKSARTVFAFAVAIALIADTRLGDLLCLNPYVERLGWFAESWLLAVIAAAALLVYVVLRVMHNIELFLFVASETTHLPVQGGNAAVIFEACIPRNP